jgi:glycosyltransferase involved in cell wall biosynthesis
MNTPRHSRHTVEFVPLLPTHRIAKRIEAVTILKPSLAPHLIHVYNRIPLGPTPFVVGFESHLPRYWWASQGVVPDRLRDLLAADQCRAIIASSYAARRIFEAQHQACDHLSTLREKLCVLYPNLELPPLESLSTACAPEAKGLHIAFIGAHFGRKGGAVGVRLAELARARDLPIHVTIVSKLEAGAGIWSDPQRATFFERYFKLLDAPNVTHIAGATNSEVLALLRRMDFSLLTTLSDTFGWSVMESMANGTPVIVTPQGALGEFVVDGENGLVIPLAVDHLNEWVHIHADKTTPAFEATYRDEVERLAEESLARLTPLIEDHAGLAAMRAGARATAERLFCSRRASPLWDNLYEDCLTPDRGRRGRSAITAHMESHGLTTERTDAGARPVAPSQRPPH